MATFESELAKWVGRKDVRRVFQTEKDSPYVAISLVANAESGEVAYVSRRELEAESPTVRFAVPVLSDDSLPLLKVELMTYGYRKLGTQVLSKLGRYFEQRDARFYAIDADTDGKPVIVGCWEYDRTQKAYTGQGTAVPHHDLLGNPLIAQISEQVAAVIERLNTNKPENDQRRPFWNDANDVTTFGHWKSQNLSDRAARSSK